MFRVAPVNVSVPLIVPSVITLLLSTLLLNVCDTDPIATGIRTPLPFV